MATRQACRSIRALRALLSNSADLVGLVDAGQTQNKGYLLTSVAEANFLRLNASNDPVTDDLVVSGNLQVNGLKVDGDTIAAILTGTGTLDFGSIAVDESADLTITVTGAAVGDVVLLGVPAGALSGGTGATDNVSFSAWVSATDTVTVRVTNNDAASAVDLASGVYRATILQY